MNLKEIKSAFGWVLYHDEQTWILQYEQQYTPWKGKVFISGDRYILENYLIACGVQKYTRDYLFWGMPGTFAEWLSGEMRAKYKDKQRKARKFQEHQAGTDQERSKPPKKGQSHRKPQRVQSGALRGRRR